ncbi:helix-turn-helix transcriptional regulator [Viridibacillus sp. FSL R5-0477]|uniref:Helix-turn-helix domain-containing protein n=1 Tax=Viridibacillus arenosi FSL R5-213 TaxID=1227360 RepID=W4EKF6_9BACL|nr:MULTISPECIES: helix-turn-helix transcriptional regulator [Viridibacillus]ETT81058.1 helix-turn-helix domain-containing protein [Viridibacillus arenosi FSL R5-213]OMC88534.1 transcriptional regulator [Viridibacillus sp. FSL H7-0596]OMC93169.1 transcriptional regulator [Viridibacillus arenosi]
MKSIANRLRILRENAELSLDVLARDINYPDIQIKAWETDQILPQIEAIKLLAIYFDVAVDWILTGEQI